MKSLRRKILFGVTAIIFLFAAFLVATHYQAKHSVDAYRKTLIAQGEKLSISELIPPAPTNGPNGAPALLAARLYSFNYDVQPTVMKFLAPGRARVSWMQEIEPSEKSTNIWPALRTLLDQNTEALAEVRVALNSDTLRFDLSYDQGFKLLLPHLAQLKDISQWLSAATVMELHQGNASAAFENLQACIALPRVYDNEPLMISQFVRIAMGAIALGATWGALQFPTWTDDQLALLQTAWAGYQPRTAMENVFGMERAMGRMTFDDARLSYYKKDALWGFRTPNTNSVIGDLREAREELMSDPLEGLRNIYLRFPHYWAWKWWWSYDEELHSIRLWQTAIEAARLAGKMNSFGAAIAHLEAQEQRLQPTNSGAASFFDFFTEMEGSPAKGYLRKVAAAQTQREMVVTAIALKRYYLRHGKYPAALAELSPIYLRELPIDWMDGKPLRYRLKENGQFLLYSVGEDRKDDGGDASVPGRSFYFWHGKDAVWPLPATAAEIAADNAAMEKERKKHENATKPFAPSLNMSEELRRRYGLTIPTNTSATNSPK